MPKSDLILEDIMQRLFSRLPLLREEIHYLAK